MALYGQTLLNKVKISIEIILIDLSLLPYKTKNN
ncbi:hypothetical protein BY457_11373 [Marinilabilia salmonicolor]|nr:hypothetical protein BY457_11373 [Marinilabilia salmonicolor]